MNAPARRALEVLLALNDRHAVLCCTLLAALTRLPTLAATDLSLDETWSWFVTSRALTTDNFLRNLELGLDAPLFAGINVLLARAFGLSVLWLRLPQAVFGILSVTLGVLLFRRLLGPRLAGLIGVMSALSPFLTAYAMNARPYAQLQFFLLLFTYAFLATPEARPSRRRILLALCTLAAIASHYYALVFLAAFYAIVLVQHLRAGRRDELRADFVTGAVSLAASAPLLVPVMLRMGALSVPYWNTSDLSLFGVLAEQIFFLGLTLAPGTPEVAAANLVMVAAWALPVVVAARARPELLREQPLIVFLGWAPVLLPVLVGVVLGRDLLFYPRGFIASAPFLLALWVWTLASVPWRRGWKRAYAALVLVVYLASSFMVASSHPRQAYLKDRQVMVEIVENVDRLAPEYDLLVVHHWWLAMYYYYRSATPERVIGLGQFVAGPQHDQVHNALADMGRIPAKARVLLVLNDLATNLTDRGGKVLSAFMARRAVLRDLPCRPGLRDHATASTVLCNRILLLSPEVAGGRPPYPASPP